MVLGSQAIMCLTWIQEEECTEELRFFPGGSSGQAAECIALSSWVKPRWHENIKERLEVQWQIHLWNASCVQAFFRFEKIGKTERLPWNQIKRCQMQPAFLVLLLLIQRWSFPKPAWPSCSWRCVGATNKLDWSLDPALKDLGRSFCCFNWSAILQS